MSPSPRELDRAARTSRLAAAGTVVGAAIVIGALVFGASRIRIGEREVEALAVRAESLRVTIAARESTLVSLTPAAARGLGYADPDRVADPDSLSESLRANQAARRLMERGAERRRTVTVRYYPRRFEESVNQDIVLPALRRAGFNLLPRPTAESMGDLGTNAIWVGAGVHPEDVQLVALILTSAGVNLRAIREYREPTGPKRGTIEIGADRQQGQASVWTTDRILQSRTFERTDPPGPRS